MAKVFVIDQKYCNGCYGCQIACKDEHCGNDWPGYQKPQPELGHFWMKLVETTHGQVPRVKLEYRPHMCQQCDACPLVERFPEAASKRDDGLVALDPEKATDPAMVEACPYHAVYWNDELAIAQKCDGCAHLVDAGDVPHCVDLCATDALRFGDEADFADEIAAATQVSPEYGTRPRVYYLNAPGLFIGGGVWTSSDDEVVTGARVTLSGDAEAQTVTDDFGDFWFRGLSKGSYTVTVEADGREPVVREVALDRSLNVGDIDLDA